MESWEKIFIGATLGLVMIIAIANAVYLCCGKARRSRSKQTPSCKSPPGIDKD
jgi:hypothetical protein